MQKWKNAVPKVGLYTPRDYLLLRSPGYKIAEGKSDRISLPIPNCISDINPRLLAERNVSQEYLETINKIQRFEDKVKSMVIEERQNRREKGQRMQEAANKADSPNHKRSKETLPKESEQRS